MVNKIRTSDVSGQIHYLSNWYKQLESEKEPTKKVTVPAAAVKRSLSGRIVKQRVDPPSYLDDSDKSVEETRKSPSQQRSETDPAPKPTSLNPFRIPVNLLNFKQTQSTLIEKLPK